jgi:hypothetical protein
VRVVFIIAIAAILSACVVGAVYILRPVPATEANIRLAVSTSKLDQLHPDELYICLKRGVPIHFTISSPVKPGAPITPSVVKTAGVRFIQTIRNATFENGKLCGSAQPEYEDVNRQPRQICFGPDEMRAVVTTTPNTTLAAGVHWAHMDSFINSPACPEERPSEK